MDSATGFGARAALSRVLLEAREMIARVDGDALVLSYSPRTRRLALLCAATIAATLGALLFADRHSADAAQTAAFVAGLVLVFGGLPLVEAFGVRHRLRDDGLERVSPWRGRRLLPWHRVASVRYRRWLGLFVVRTSDGKSVYLRQYLSGLSTFARWILQRAPGAIGDAREHQRLRELAAQEQAVGDHDEGIDRWRDTTGWGYDALTRVFAPDETRAIGRWPVLAVLPFAVEPAVAGDAGAVLANLLRRDLALVRGLSVVGIEDTPALTPDQFAAAVREATAPLPWDWVALATVRIDVGGRVRIEGRLVKVDDPSVPRSLDVAADAIGAACTELAGAFARALELPVADEVARKWHKGRPLDWASVERCGRAWAAQDVALLVDELRAGRVHPDALALVTHADVEPALLHAGVALAAAQDPDNVQLAFGHFTNVWRGAGRHSRAVRILRAALEVAPGHGKSQMCFAHLIDHKPANQEHVLAHAETGYRLLRGNSFAISNFMLHLRSFVPDDARLLGLTSELLETDPENPRAYTAAIETLSGQGRHDEALEHARRLRELCTPPINERTLYCYRQNPTVAADLDAGRFDPLAHAEFLVHQCEEALRRSRVH